jgi:hypothetical protein
VEVVLLRQIQSLVVAVQIQHLVRLQLLRLVVVVEVRLLQLHHQAVRVVVVLMCLELAVLAQEVKVLLAGQFFLEIISVAVVVALAQ